MFKPRPYQQKIIDECRTALSRGFLSPLVQAPTGSGKTIIFAWIVKQVTENKKRALVLTHRREILEQTIKKFYGFGITCGQIASRAPMTHDLAQVAMIGTLINRLEQVQKPDIIIIDEGHHSAASMWERVLNYFYDVPRIGFSATPERLDGQGLGDLFDIMIHGPSVKYLVENGFLSEPHIFSSELALGINYHVTRGDYDLQEQTETMSRRIIVGDAIDHKRQYLPNLPTITFCPSIKHCQTMEDSFNDAGIKTMTIHGKLKDQQREDMIKALGDGTIENICSCEVISEGVDIPIVAGAIMMRKTMSLSLYLQQAGRALRTYPGKKAAVILDQCGNVFRHGHVMNDRKWSLNQEKKKAKQEKAPEITRCPRCMLVLAGKPAKCTACGYVFPKVSERARADRIEQVEGELRKVMPENMTDADGSRTLAEFIDSLNNLPPEKRHYAAWVKANELGDKAKIKRLGEMMGYHKNWINEIWPSVARNVGV